MSKRTPRELALFRQNKRLREALEHERSRAERLDAERQRIAKALATLIDFTNEWKQEQECPF